MSNEIISYIKNYYKKNSVLTSVFLTGISLLIITYSIFSFSGSAFGPDPDKVMGIIIIDLCFILILISLFIKKFVYPTMYYSESRLQKRIIMLFCIIATIPTIIVSVFSIYFFYSGIQSWFDQKISAVLSQSIIVAESYINEHKVNLRATTSALAYELNEEYYKLAHKPEIFAEILHIQAQVRSLDEIIIFHRPSNTMIANTALSFVSSFSTIPSHLIEEADNGKIVEIKSNPRKLRMLIRFKDYNEIYLIVGKLIDNNVIEHINNTNGANDEYQRLKKNIYVMQVKFFIIFIFIAMMLLSFSVILGVVLASKIVDPIKTLVRATEKVKEGDLTIQVPEKNSNHDEISILSIAFNRMIKQIYRQQRDLVIAQRALAWSDVAQKVAHEIKNPLTPIHLASERLIRKFSNQVQDKEDFLKYVNMIIRHSDDIKTIVSEFVNFARLPAPVLAKCDIVKIVKNLTDSRKLLNDSIEYKFNSDNISIDFICDEKQINQIIINLMKNAEESVKSVNLTTESSNYHSAIEVTIKSDLELITIEVNDNGTGFSQNLIEKATEAYVTTRSKGTGIGLAIVKKIAQDHCATLAIANLTSGGASISITFDMNRLEQKLKNEQL